MTVRALAILLAAGGALCGASNLVSVRIEPKDAVLHGAESSQHFLLIGTYSDGIEADLTGEARWQLSDPALARMENGGRLWAQGEGALTLSASAQGRAARVPVRLENVRDSRPFLFSRDIGGIFTRRGCNNANCHGGVKGRGGFKLSAGALHPKEDFEWIVKGGTYQVLTAEIAGTRLPRVDLQNPEQSLLLLKATGKAPHGGGQRFAIDSGEFRTILNWVGKGAPYGPEEEGENSVTRLEIFPRVIALPRGAKHRFLVTAHLADGRREDFTHQALYVSNDNDIASVGENGLVSATRLGETALLVRAAGHAVTATVGVIGEALAQYPRTPSANFIDDFIFGKLRRFNIVPSGLSSDAEFLRRICLDLTGTLPPPERVREFVASKDPRKREKLIETLIESPEFIDYWTFRFSDLFRVAVFSNGIQPKWSQMYWEWIRESIASNKPYDRIARERLTAQGYDGPTRHYLPYDVIAPPPESMAEEVRVFFGRRLDCAQCHNHPYENWSQDQFWGMAAFFGRVFKMGDTGTEYVIFDHPLDEDWGNGDVDGNLKMFHPRTKAELRPTLLDGKTVSVPSSQNPRHELARWMTTHPYFAEAAVNRIWGWLFGRGLVDPVDDFRSTNPATHPELLDRLAREFRAHGHDVRWLIRTIAASQTYQLSSEPNDSNREDRTNYSHSLVRPLDAEPLLDAISDVTGVPETFSTGVSDKEKALGQAPDGTRAIQLHEPDLFFSRFLELYGRPNRLTLPERNGKANLGQALHMLAGPGFTEKLAAPGSRLRRMLDRGGTDKTIFEEFYLAAFARPAESDEIDGLEKLVSARSSREEGLKDFVWAILTSREFAENH